ncbi:MAG TPA: AAA family ATPase [Steroidobacteraceae bacterium]|jgi:DNA-binding CsgD family transcriptional regulator|nr:AAA family ATPase [Steroidobacteraceae bacterium]
MNLLERHEQLEILEQSFAEARAGSGKLVLIAGEAGMGKSSLVEQFVAQTRRHARILWGACDALDTPRALGPVHEIAAQTSVLDGRTRLPDESRDWLFGALLAQLVPPQRTSIVVLEDVHWADESTLDFFRYIGRRVQRTGALLIATYREEELSPTHPVRRALGELTGRHVIRMRLAPLSSQAVGEMAKDSGRDAELLHQITGGNPFFVFEALAYPGERVPETVRDAVLARLLRCSQAARELAELVSISPGKTEGWLIESMMGTHGAAIDEGVMRGLLAAHGDAVSFRHELARLAVHSTLPPERARAMHAKVLKVLEGHGADLTHLVHHAALANDAGAVLKYAPLAAAEAARLGAHREAAAHLSAALRYRDALATTAQAELFERHAEECGLTNLPLTAVASGKEALARWRLAGNIEAQARVLSFMTTEYRMAGDKVGANESIAEAIALLEPLPPTVHLARVYGVRSRLASHRGLEAESVSFGERALALARRFGDAVVESHALNSMGSALLIAGDLSGYGPLERSLSLALEKNLDESAARGYSNLMFCATLNHHIARAEQFFRDGVAYCEERGQFSSIAYLKTYAARLALDRGDWSEAAQLVLELSRSIELVPVQRVPTRTTLALVRIRRGDPGADEVLHEISDMALSMDEPERMGRIAAAHAELAWYRGDLGEVARQATVGLDTLADRCIPWARGELLFWLSRAQAVDAGSAPIPEPYRLMLSGEWQAAADAWEKIGMPYEQALCLAEGSDAALLCALAILDRLGAGPLESVVRKRLRERGVRGVPRGPRETTRSNPKGLSEKEFEVLALLVEGCSNARIAARLHRSTKTIDHHVSAILAKLDVDSRAEAITAAFGLGLFGARPDAKVRGRHPRRG